MPIPSRSIESFALLFALLSGAACGASPARSETPSAGTDIAGARALEGPFATWEEICGAPVERPEGATGDRYERCAVEVTALAGGGAFEAMATYREGTGFDGDASLALKTERGWFVQQVPDGEVFPRRGHHSPASASFDPEATRVNGGVLRVVSRGSSASFVPGRGPLGSSSSEWTRVQRCGVRDGVVVCGQAETVWSRRCSVSEEPAQTTGEPSSAPTGERRCEDEGTDVR